MQLLAYTHVCNMIILCRTPCACYKYIMVYFLEIGINKLTQYHKYFISLFVCCEATTAFSLTMRQLMNYQNISRHLHKVHLRGLSKMRHLRYIPFIWDNTGHASPAIIKEYIYSQDVDIVVWSGFVNKKDFLLVYF